MTAETKIRAKTRAALACAAFFCSTMAQGADLTINLTGMQSDSGQVLLSLLNSEAQMKGAEPTVTSMKLPANVAGVKVTLHDLDPGVYGIQLMLDENGNGKLDSNLLGIPKEPWAFSNNAKGRFGPPSWEDVQFTIGTESVQQSISF